MDKVKKIVLLGSTGSIGENVLSVVRALEGRIVVKALAANSNWERVLEQAREFGVEEVGLSDQESARACLQSGDGFVVRSGSDGVAELAASEDVDLVVCAIVGIASLKPVLAALQAGTDVALSSKEALVTGGRIVRRACMESGAKLLPVDSEHSAIFQCLPGNAGGLESDTISKVVKRLILTASGGPFGSVSDVDLEKVSIEQVLKHPNWDMGDKVTVDSATLMNKGLEIMEAQWLFDMPLSRISVVIHPESIVHSLVEFVDGNMLAQLCRPDMRYAIQYALTFPERVNAGLQGLDLADIGKLTFTEPDNGRFPCLDLARRAAGTGGTMPTVLNAANEVAVDKFLAGRIRFPEIWEMVEKVMDSHQQVEEPDLDGIMEADAWARNFLNNKGV